MKGVPVPGDYSVQPVITEKKVWNQKNIIFALILTILLIAIEFIAVILLELSPMDASVLGFLLIFIYAVVLFFLVEPTLVREIKSSDVRVIGDSGGVRIVERPVIRTVERPVIQEVEKVVKKPVPFYIEKKRKKLNIPKYKYVGSSESKTYHKKSCRLGKLIKKKYKLNSNTESYFKIRKFEPCKVCLKKSAKKIAKEKKGKVVKKKTVKFVAKKPVKKVVKFKAKK